MTEQRAEHALQRRLEIECARERLAHLEQRRQPARVARRGSGIRSRFGGRHIRSPTYLRGDAACARKAVVARSLEQRIDPPARRGACGRGAWRPPEHDLFVVTEKSHHESVPFPVSQQGPHCIEFPLECEQRHRTGPISAGAAIAMHVAHDHSRPCSHAHAARSPRRAASVDGRRGDSGQSTPPDPIDRPPPAHAARRRPAQFSDPARARRTPVPIRCRRLPALRRAVRAERCRPAHLRLIGRRSSLRRRAHGALRARAADRDHGARTAARGRDRRHAGHRGWRVARARVSPHRLRECSQRAARHCVRHPGSGPRGRTGAEGAPAGNRLGTDAAPRLRRDKSARAARGCSARDPRCARCRRACGRRRPRRSSPTSRCDPAPRTTARRAAAPSRCAGGGRRCSRSCR